MFQDNKNIEKKIWQEIDAVVNQYEMLEDQDCLLVGITGDGSSLMLARKLKELKEKQVKSFQMKFMVFVPNDDKEAEEEIIHAVNAAGITEYTIFSGNFVQEFYNELLKMNCNKVVLTQNYDMIVERTFMSFVENKEVKEFLPKFFSPCYEGVEFICPLCQVKEADIQKWVKQNHMTVASSNYEYHYIPTENRLDMMKRRTKKRFMFRVYEGV